MQPNNQLKIVRKLPLRKGETECKRRYKVKCLACNSGEIFEVKAAYLTRKENPKEHCGCLNRSLRTQFNREYRIWTMMRVRTTNPLHISYKHYGARGIKVCAEWFDFTTGFEKFLEYIGPAPSLKHSIDRIDPDGD